MKILVTGHSGQLGYDVVKEGLRRGLDLYGVGSKELDITDKDSVNKYMNNLKPDAIIHCAAYTAVDKAEDDKENCWNVNVEGTKYLSLAAKNLNAKFMYISTDYVFDGNGAEPFTEMDTPNPIGHYGHTKFEGEKFVQNLLEFWFIIRISWVFGINGNNFIKTMLRLADNNNELQVVNDQVGSPTYTGDLARLLIDMIQTEKFGIYHATNTNFCNWAEFAKEIFRLAGKKAEVNGITTNEYPTRARRPKNSRLSTQKLIDSGFEPLPSWQDALQRYLKELMVEVK
jgi:dTDP-4-dehydrorhamnose reductase